MFSSKREKTMKLKNLGILKGMYIVTIKTVHK